MAHAQALIKELKRALREAGLTYRDVANHLDLSEASVKRLFREHSFSLERLLKTLALTKLDMRDLAERATANREYLTMLTPEQESALVADRLLLLVTFLVVNRWRYDDILAHYAIDEAALRERLRMLDRLAMIELLPFNRYRLLTARNFTWRWNGPVQKAFATSLRSEFFDHPFSGADDKLRFLTGSLSKNSIRQLKDKVEELVSLFDQLADRDARSSNEQRQTFSSVLAMRPIEYSVFADFRRD